MKKIIRTPEEKIQIVQTMNELLSKGFSIAEIAQQLHVALDNLYRWRAGNSLGKLGGSKPLNFQSPGNSRSTHRSGKSPLPMRGTKSSIDTACDDFWARRGMANPVTSSHYLSPHQ